MKKGLVFSIVGALSLLYGCLAAIDFLHDDTSEEMDKNFYLLGKYNSVIEYGNEFIDEGFNATIDGENVNNYVAISTTLNPKKLGDYDIYYRLNYDGEVKVLQRHVSIVDKQPPILNVNCEEETYVEIGSNFKVCDYDANDNYDGNLKDNVIVTNNVDTSKEGDYKITYLVSDSSNNSISKTVNLHVREKDEITYIKIIISEQRLYYYKNNKLVLETPVTTGKNNYTKTGDFRIRNKVRNATLKGADYVSEVKYWMAYNGNSFGIHDASWRRKFGGQDYKWNGSHGCVNVPTDAARQLFETVDVGTAVYIRN